MSLIIDFIFRRHLQEQEDTLKKLMENRQIQQMKELDTLFEKYVVVLSISLVFNLASLSITIYFWNLHQLTFYNLGKRKQ